MIDFVLDLYRFVFEHEGTIILLVILYVGYMSWKDARR